MSARGVREGGVVSLGQELARLEASVDMQDTSVHLALWHAAPGCHSRIAGVNARVLQAPLSMVLPLDSDIMDMHSDWLLLQVRLLCQEMHDGTHNRSIACVSTACWLPSGPPTWCGLHVQKGSSNTLQAGLPSMAHGVGVMSCYKRLGSITVAALMCM